MRKTGNYIPDAEQTENLIEEYKESAKNIDTEKIGMLSEAFKKTAQSSVVNKKGETNEILLQTM